MPSRDFQDLAAAQRESVDVLRTLTRQLQRDSRSEELERLVRPLSSSAGRSTASQGAPSSRPLAGFVPVLPTGGGGALPSAAPGADGIEQALNLNRRAIQDLGATLSANTKALDQSTSAFTGGIRGLLAGLPGAGGGGSGLGGLLKAGFGLVPLGLRLAGLFRKSKAEPDPLLPFELPGSLAVEAANTSNILSGFPRVARGQLGEVRAIERIATPASAPQVVVNVNAMDTQSFLDRSSDIARAVREAMLHMHPVNDVIGEI